MIFTCITGYIVWEPKISSQERVNLTEYSLYWKPLITFPSTSIWLIDKRFCIARGHYENSLRAAY